jgi:antitoxin CptB
MTRGVPSRVKSFMEHNAATDTAVLDTEARRLLWRCRRGMKELDILLERFARAELPTADAAQRTLFARFLELPDPVLVDYLLGQPGMGQELPPDPELAALIKRIIGLAPGGQTPMAELSTLRHDPAPKRAS